jgi:hypothetical protein
MQNPLANMQYAPASIRHPPVCLNLSLISF